jgi:hypothetical protein
MLGLVTVMNEMTSGDEISHKCLDTIRYRCGDGIYIPCFWTRIWMLEQYRNRAHVEMMEEQVSSVAMWYL